MARRSRKLMTSGVGMVGKSNIIPMTEEDKKRDREQILEYTKENPDNNYMNNLLKKYGRNGRNIAKMFCGLCKKEVYPLDSHMGRINGKLDVFHIDCWNEYYKDEIQMDKIHVTSV